MAEIGRQSDEVPGDRATLDAALFEHASCEGMAKIVDARLLASLRRNSRSPQDAAERVIHGRRAERPVPDGWEQPIACAGVLAARLEIAAERLDDRRMQWHEPALAELGLADVQHTIGPNVVKLERDRLRDAQSGGGDQPEQHDVELVTQGIGLLLPEPAGGIEDAGDLVRGIDIGDRSRLPASREVGARDVMPRIFGMQEAREQDQVR